MPSSCVTSSRKREASSTMTQPLGVSGRKGSYPRESATPPVPPRSARRALLSADRALDRGRFRARGQAVPSYGQILPAMSKVATVGVVSCAPASALL